MIITIQDSKASASIDSVGAQLISYQDPSGREYVWQRNPDYWANCSPLLFLSLEPSGTAAPPSMVPGMKFPNTAF